MVFANNIYFEDARLVYIAIPKAANSALKSAFLPLIGLEQRAYSNIHDRELVPFNYVNTKRVKKIRERAFVFSVVRNPWDRIASTYADKVCREPIHKPFERYGFVSHMSFEDFVRGISDIPDSDADVHFRSQHSMLFMDGCLLPHMLLKMERLQKDWPLLRGIVETLTKKQTGELKMVNRKQHAPYREYYDTTTRDLVGRRYADEIQLLGYEF